MSGKGRNWCFTFYNQDDLSFREFEDKLRKWDAVKYCIFQEEECPDTRRRHLQGYVEFTSSLRLSKIKSVLHRSIHLDQRRGTAEAARDYCRKEDSRVSEPVEWGEFSRERQGQRTDMEEIKDLLDSGASSKQVSESHFGQWVRYHKAFEKYELIHSSQRDWVTEVFVFWGEPGSGKTRRVMESAEVSTIFKLPRPTNGTVWWDGYIPKQHTTILLDDFYGWVPFCEMLHLMDRYPHQVPVKGGFIPFLAKKIYITSNVNWEEWYDFTNKHMNKGAFKRRIKETVYFPFTNDLV